MRLAAALIAPVFLASATLALAEDDPGLAKARAQVRAMTGECDADAGNSEAFQNHVYQLSWTDTSYDPKGEESKGTLYEIYCFSGAYNVMMNYLFAYEGSDPTLVAFPEPVFEFKYEDGDETYTKLVSDPVMTGIDATVTLVNPGFDPATMTISSFSKWRGLGDAWSSGTWTFKNGSFVLTEFTIDPIYEFNLDDPPETLTDKSFTLYKAKP